MACAVGNGSPIRSGRLVASRGIDAPRWNISAGARYLHSTENSSRICPAQRNTVHRQLTLPATDNTRARFDQWAAVPLRLMVGYGFMAHGYAKLARGPGYFVASLHALGVPWPALMGWTTIFVELIGGLAVLIGVLIPFVSIPLAAIMLVAVFTVHLPYGFSSIKLQSVTKDGPQFGKPGYETSLLYLAGLATLVVGGPGPLAVGRLRVKGRRDSIDG
jgi:putative oxidoreductase